MGPERFRISMEELGRDLTTIVRSNFFLPIDPSCKLEYDQCFGDTGGVILTPINTFHECLPDEEQEALRALYSDLFIKSEDTVIPLFTYPNNVYIAACKMVGNDDENFYCTLFLRNMGGTYDGYVLYNTNAGRRAIMIARDLKKPREYSLVKNEDSHQKIKMLEKRIVDYSRSEYEDNSLLFV